VHNLYVFLGNTCQGADCGYPSVPLDFANGLGAAYSRECGECDMNKGLCYNQVKRRCDRVATAKL